MMPAEFHLLRPVWLVLLIPLVIVLWALLRSRGDVDEWRGLVDGHLLPRLLVAGSGASRWLPMVLLGLAWLLAVLALAGPTWQRLPQAAYQAQLFRVVVLDVSASMNAADVAPSRLTQARFRVLDLLRYSQDGYTALLVFGAEPYVVSPLTTDSATIAAQVPRLETALLPVHGARRTALALDEAERLLRQSGAVDGQVLLLSDGVDDVEAANESARRLVAAGHRLSVLGIGTRAGSPVRSGDGGLLKDRDGAIVVAKLDAAALKRLAEAGDGTYLSASAGERDVERLLAPSSGAALDQQTQQADAHAEQWREEGPWLLLALLPLAALAFRRGWLSPLLIVALVLPHDDAYAITWLDLWQRDDQQAIDRLDAGDASGAAQLFERPDWRAASRYRAGEYERALALLADQTDADAAYNRGNTLARMGRLEEAVAAYDQALSVEPDDQDARHNRNLLKQLIDQQRARQSQAGDDGDDQHQDSAQAGDGDEQSGTQSSDPSRGDDAAEQGDSQSSDRAAGDASSGASSSHANRADAGNEAPTNAGDQQATDTEQQSAAQQPAQEPERRSAANEDGDQGEPSGDEERRQPSIAADKDDGQADQGRQPGLADLLGGDNAARSKDDAGRPSPAEIESAQAMEQMLRRVDDDPGGLLRQRFLLQHLRRNGRL